MNKKQDHLEGEMILGAGASKIKYICVHHTAVSYSKNPDQFKATNEFHKQQWNMKSSLGLYGGYNYEIAKEGKVGQFRKDGEETIGAVGHNFDTIHIALDGNYDIELPTEKQKESLKKLLSEKMKEYSIPLSNIVPHRKWASKSCFGNLLSDTWASDLVASNSLTAQLDNVVKQLIDIRNSIK